MANRASLRNLCPFPLKILNIYPPHWILYPWIKRTSKRKQMLKGSYTAYGVAHYRSHCFTDKFTYTVNSMLAHLWILSCVKPRAHSRSWILESSDPCNTCIKTVTYLDNSKQMLLGLGNVDKTSLNKLFFGSFLSYKIQFVIEVDTLGAWHRSPLKALFPSSIGCPNWLLTAHSLLL